MHTNKSKLISTYKLFAKLNDHAMPFTGTNYTEKETSERKEGNTRF